MVFDVAVFIPCGEPWRIGSCHVEACLIIFEGVTDVRDAIGRNVESGSYFFEDVTERDKSAHACGKR